MQPNYCMIGRRRNHGQETERAGFEPAIRTRRIRHFQCRSFSHSDTSPRWRCCAGSVSKCAIHVRLCERRAILKIHAGAGATELTTPLVHPQRRRLATRRTTSCASGPASTQQTNVKRNSTARPARVDDSSVAARKAERDNAPRVECDLGSNAMFARTPTHSNSPEARIADTRS